MKFLTDILSWMMVFFIILSGAFKQATDGALFAYFRPQLEALVEQLPEFIQWML